MFQGRHIGRNGHSAMGLSKSLRQIEMGSRKHFGDNNAINNPISDCFTIGKDHQYFDYYGRSD